MAVACIESNCRAGCSMHRRPFAATKRPGTYQSPDQKAFQADAEKAGAHYAAVRSIDDV
jgi:hypothetical protein